MKSKNVDGSRFRLRDDEYLLWTGQPSQGLQFSVNDWFLIPAALIWSTLFAYASYVSILRADGSESLLWQVPSFVLATYILFWRFADRRGRLSPTTIGTIQKTLWRRPHRTRPRIHSLHEKDPIDAAFGDLVRFR